MASLFDDFQWYDWLFAPLGAYKTTKNMARMLGVISDGSNSAESELQHAEEREDTAIQRRVADYQAAGLNPALAYNTDGASSAAAQSTLSTGPQQTNALTNILGTALSLFLMKGSNSSGKLAANSARNVNNYYYLDK